MRVNGRSSRRLQKNRLARQSISNRCPRALPAQPRPRQPEGARSTHNRPEVAFACERRGQMALLRRGCHCCFVGVRRARAAEAPRDPSTRVSGSSLPTTGSHCSTSGGPENSESTPTVGGELEAEIVAGEVTEEVLVLDGTYDIVGLVVDEGSRPVAGARVFSLSWRSDWTGAREVATSDANGRFRIRAIDDERSLGATAAGHGPSDLVDIKARAGLTEPVPSTGDTGANTRPGCHARAHGLRCGVDRNSRDPRWSSR